MTSTSTPPRRHLGLLVIPILAMIAVLVTRGTTAAVGIAMLIAVPILGIAGWMLDERYPEASIPDALVRILGIGIGLSLLWLIAGLGDERNGLITLGVVLVAVAAMAFRRYQTARLTASAPVSSPAQATGHLRPEVEAPSSVDPRQAVQWPAAPPTVSASVSPPAAPVAPAIPPGLITEPATPRPSAVHRWISLPIVMLWLPLGVFFMFILNYCPPTGGELASFLSSLVFVGGQVFVNPLAGWWLDRRFSNRGGTLLAFGRSIIAAVAIAVAFGLLAWLVYELMIEPGASSNYCG